MSGTQQRSDPLLIRPHIAERAVYVAFAALIDIGAVTVLFVADVGGSLAAIIPTMLVPVLVTVITVGNVRARVIASGDELRIRNAFRNHQIHRSRIVRFEMGSDSDGEVVKVRYDDDRQLRMGPTQAARSATRRRHLDALRNWLVS